MQVLAGYRLVEIGELLQVGDMIYLGNNWYYIPESVIGMTKTDNTVFFITIDA